MKRICDKSGVKKRHFHYTEETLTGRPEFLDHALPSLNARLAIAADAVPELAASAAARAIAEWGRPATNTTHLVVSTNSGASSPGADLRLAELLSLRPTVQRTLLYLHGCFGGCSALRVARDLVENNRGAHVLVAVSEVSTMLSFRAPVEANPEALVAAALFGDGAGRRRHRRRRPYGPGGAPHLLHGVHRAGDVAGDRAHLVYAARERLL
ncbi:hypothetical protein SEVIR_8G149650v4 [Setaria viridis]|uniref:Chalcone/stilbene synthase N-terminal domain-containing protein n=1 Tax=Setaria viridis TaxID=4556 RepID=A0A4U6TFK1_SETVI|nr:hypothetical protein SEVIR_8G149650v2 [Setaria viridis]